MRLVKKKLLYDLPYSSGSKCCIAVVPLRTLYSAPGTRYIQTEFTFYVSRNSQVLEEGHESNNIVWLLPRPKPIALDFLSCCLAKNCIYLDIKRSCKFLWTKLEVLQLCELLQKEFVCISVLKQPCCYSESRLWVIYVVLQSIQKTFEAVERFY